MPTLVDTNLILDIATDDPVWADWSDARITQFQESGLIVNPVIFAELCTGADHLEEVELILVQLKLELVELTREALFLAGKAFPPIQAARRHKNVATSRLFHWRASVSSGDTTAHP